MHALRLESLGIGIRPIILLLLPGQGVDIPWRDVFAFCFANAALCHTKEMAVIYFSISCHSRLLEQETRFGVMRNVWTIGEEFSNAGELCFDAISSLDCKMFDTRRLRP